MNKGLFKKVLAHGIILLFVGTGVIPSMSGTVLEKTTIMDSKSGGYIQNLINNANDGDTINIPSGTYYENIVIDKSIKLIGEDKDTTIIDGDANSYVISITASNVQVSGFNIKNCEDWKSNIYMYKVHNCLITDNIIIGNDFGLINGIDIEYSDNNTIRNNIITNFYQAGIHLYVSTHNLIENNEVTSCYYRGILIHYHSNENYVTTNSCIETGTGIQLHTNCSENNVYENTVLNSREGGIFLHKVGGNNVYNNSVYNNSFGIGTQYSQDNEIYSNTLTDNSIGIYFQHDSYDNNIFENYIGNHNIGVQTYQSTSNNILNNTIVNNQKGIFIDSLTNNYYIVKNNIFNNNIGIELSFTTQNNISKNFMTNIESNILLEESYDNTIFQNTIQESLNGIKSLNSSSNYFIKNTLLYNYDGIKLDSSSDKNIIYHNNFISNTQNAYDESNNTWDNSYPSGGNYWDKYNGTDNDGDGIGNTPFPIPGGDNEDMYPLMYPSCNVPPNKPIINGPSRGKPGIEHEYTFNTTDLNDDPVMYFIEWGDDTTERTENSDSGEEVTLKHSWIEEGEYIIKAKSKDINGAESNWSKYKVEIPRTRATSNLWYHWFLDHFPLLEKLVILLRVT